MKRNLFYVIGLIVLYGLFMSFYSVSLVYFESQDKHFKTLAKNYKDQPLRQSRRGIASIESKRMERPDLSDLSEFYFSRYRELMKRGQSDQAVQMLSRVQNFSSDANMQMRSSYYKADYFCNKGLEKECLKQIDYMVSLSPESPWSGHALVLLAEYYSSHRKLQELLLLKDVISEQFKANSEVIQKLNKINI
jgi:hypothetical protein